MVRLPDLLDTRDEPKNILTLNNRGVLSVSIVYPEPTPGVIPGDRPVNTGNHARAAFEASGEFHLHLAGFLVEGIEVGGA